MPTRFKKDLQYYKFCMYGFFKNQRYFDPFLILFFIEKDLSFFLIGILYSVREIIRNIFEIPSGIIADIFGRRKSMIFSFFMYLISFIIFYLSQSFVNLLIAMIFFAIGDAFRTGTHKAMIFEYLKIKSWNDQKIDYYGHTRSWSQRGSALSALIAAIIVFYNDNFSSVFLYSLIPYVIDLLLMISYPKYLDGKRNTDKKIMDQIKTIVKEFIISLKNIKILIAITNLSSYSGYYKAIKDYLQPVLKSLALTIPVLTLYGDKQRTAIIIGLVYFSIFILTSIASRNSGRIAALFKNYYYPLNISLICGFSLGILCGVFYHWGFIIVSIILFLMINIIENIRKPIGIAYVTDLFKQDILATALSAQSQAITIFAAIIAPLLGLFADIFGIAYSLAITSVLLLALSPFILAKSRLKK